MEVRERYQVKISNKFARLENLDDCRHINRAWENTRMLKSGINHDLPNLFKYSELMKDLKVLDISGTKKGIFEM